MELSFNVESVWLKCSPITWNLGRFFLFRQWLKFLGQNDSIFLSVLQSIFNFLKLLYFIGIVDSSATYLIKLKAWANNDSILEYVSNNLTKYFESVAKRKGFFFSEWFKKFNLQSSWNIQFVLTYSKMEVVLWTTFNTQVNLRYYGVVNLIIQSHCSLTKKSYIY